MTDTPTLLHFRDEKHYHTAVDVIAGDRLSDPVNDLKQCSEKQGPYTVALGAALDAVREARKARKKPAPPRRRPRWMQLPAKRQQPGGDAA